jgi:hypothetical protein
LNWLVRHKIVSFPYKIYIFQTLSVLLKKFKKRKRHRALTASDPRYKLPHMMTTRFLSVVARPSQGSRPDSRSIHVIKIGHRACRVWIRRLTGFPVFCYVAGYSEDTSSPLKPRDIDTWLPPSDEFRCGRSSWSEVKDSVEDTAALLASDVAWRSKLSINGPSLRSSLEKELNLGIADFCRVRRTSGDSASTSWHETTMGE